MKNILLLPFLFSLTIAFGANFSSDTKSYQIVKSEFNKDIPDGYFVLKGFVKDKNSGNAIGGAVLTDSTQTKGGNTTTDGAFTFMFPLADSILYCYSENHFEEIIRHQFKEHYAYLIEINLSMAVTVTFKPVIYLYGDDVTAELEIVPTGEFKFVYPPLNNNKWNINSSADGICTDLSTGKKYPYLFWEGNHPNLHFIQNENSLEAFLIDTDTSVIFFENILAEIGLNTKEATDFITFWGPRVQASPYVLIQFLTTQQYGKEIAELKINPQPQNILRLHMYFLPLEHDKLNIELIRPHFQKISREGFTVIEWGGSELKPEQLIN
ncbi:MAG: hypothetical protein IPM74_07725 [Crocinitomicaceae bacterium]|nr:hypothetical protein [Crocinitomicaceae bacterium]MBK8925789.1 hypothetical protein [Crocinitomicaceae bacterium]